MNLPNNFIQTIQNVFGEKGNAWLNSLPSLIDAARQRWGLKNIQPAPNLSYNYVAFAERPSPIHSHQLEDVVLKIGVPAQELTSELTALQLFNGQGACLLLAADSRLGMLLLERVRPGKMLSTLKDDEEATHYAADVMLKLWKPATFTSALIELSDWFKGFDKLRTRFEGGTGPLEKKLVERAEMNVRGFFAEEYTPMLIHGDLHHFNILSSERGWLAIDPKGVIGPPGYEVGPLLVNPWGDLRKSKEIERLTKRRIAILSERLGFEKERILEWSIAHAVLSAWWGIEDNTGWEYAMGCAAIFSQIKSRDL